MPDQWARLEANGVVLTVHLQPNASRTECAGFHGEALKVRIAAPPVDGAANAALVRFLADRMSLSSRDVTILSGTSSRSKRVLLRRATLATVKDRLGR